ncbi:MAG: hypothetical protein K2G28_12525 [Acetatifactor sp.]|nr:hypothetical protein [Acetatifactor sp.]MDE7354302.1 hypothetical protein [Acetatifactor sp.]
MRDKKIFVTLLLITTVISFTCGCGRQAEPANAELTGTVEEADTEESTGKSTEENAKPTSSSAALKESTESSEAEDNSEREVDATEEPVPNENPVATEKPAQTETPVATEKPVQTEKPAAAEKTAATETPAQPRTEQQSVPAASQPTQTTPVQNTEPVQSEPAQSDNSSAPAPTPAPTPAPAHTHSWSETGRNEKVDCFAGTAATTINYSCNCGETKTETQTAASNCDWQWVGEWHYDNSGCVKQRVAYHTCVTHNTMTTEMPRLDEVDEHNYCENRVEPSCDTKGEVSVSCSKCGMHFPDKSYSITNDKYPDGGGSGHNFVESSRRDLSEEEAAWYGENKAWVTYACSACGESYDDVVNK